MKDVFVYFEAFLGTAEHPQALNVWGWGSHAEAQQAMCEFLGEPLSESVAYLHDTKLCVDYDPTGIGKGECSTILTIRKSLSVPTPQNHPILAETTTRMKER